MSDPRTPTNATAAASADAPYRDATRPVAERAADLLSRLTDTEKVAMLHQHAPAVERLGLAPFHTGAEVLHGVSWLGEATSFPQPVGLGATWDPDLLARVGEVVGIELRAKHAADPSVSLNVWAPVVNPLRHPAWGRTEEGYSEDPWVTAELATAYARGLRGDHPRYWRTVPTLKHAFGYSNETDRAVTSSQLRPRVLHEYELPAFLGPIEAGVAGAVMASYNLVNGRPAHLSGELLDLLRAATEESLMIVSDAAAPGFVVDLQRFHDDHTRSHAAMLRAGIDSFTDNDANATPTIERVTAALDRGLLDQAVVDRAVLRQLELRIATGELDPELDPFVVAADAIDLPEHRALAREAVAASVVVLENGGALPVAPTARVAVVGPLADRVLHDWYSGTPPYLVGIGTALAGRVADLTVAAGDDRVTLRAASTGALVRVGGPTHALTADGRDDADPAAQHDLTDWGDLSWTLRPASTGLLWTGGAWVVRADSTRVGGWVAQETFRRHTHDDGTVSWQHAGSGKWLRVQHDEVGTLVADGAVLADAERFALELLRDGRAEVRAAAEAADVVLVAVGNDPHVGGRETQDRPSLELPDGMLATWEAAAGAVARVLVVVSSYPYALPADLGADAVVWTSHGGQELGNGLADVLLGDVEPRGRLTQAWPASPDEVGDLFDYDVIAGGLTSRYAHHAPRYGLGHGLTYSTVAYGDVASVPSVTADDAEAEVRVEVRNDGDRTAHELVQVYAQAPAHRLPFGRPLVGHARAVLAPGTTTTVTVPVAVHRLATWDVTRDRLVVEPGTYELVVGPSSAVAAGTVPLEVVGEPVPPRDWAGPVRAVDADELDDVELAAATRERGDALQVARRRSQGSATYRDGDLRGARRFSASVSRTHDGAAGLRVDVLDAGAWHTLAELDVPATDDRYAWVPVTADVVDLPDHGDVRVTLTGAARLREVRLER